MKPSKLSTISSSRLEYIRDSPQYDWRNMFIATLLGWSISFQVDIKIDQVFMENSSTLFQFSKALYPRRVAVMPSFE